MSNIQQNAQQESAQTLPGMLADVASRFADRAAIVENGKTISYAQLQQLSRQAARALMTLGVQSGDRVALWAPNVSEWIVAACGVHAAGGVLVPLNTRMKGAEAADILDRSRAKVLVSVGDFLNNYYPDLLAGQRPATLQQVVVLGDKVLPSADLSWSQFMAKADATSEQDQLQRQAQIKPDDTADLMFTSGTTGRPKGVMAAHRPTILAFKAWSDVVGLTEGSRYLIVNPFFHTFGYKAGWVAALLQGATVYPEQVFDAEAILRRIESDRISFMPGPPTLFLSMLAHPQLKSFDLSSLEASVTGASTVPPILIKRMREELGIKNVTTAYGLTECGGCATLCDPSDDVETVANTCGKALPGTEVTRVSSLYGSAPVDATGPDYLNAIAEISTALSPLALLDALQQIELAAGRERPYRNAPRTLDLDILLWGDERIASPTLTVPHPRLHERAFVLLPLAELAPERVTSAQLQAVQAQAIARAHGPDWVDSASAPDSCS